MPIQSVWRSLYYMMTFRLRFPQNLNGKTIMMEVRFQFKKFGHRLNMILSRIPILLIAGTPGFQNKIWMIDWNTDYWQGVYQFQNIGSIKKYKKSFVFGVMNKRAVSETITYQILPDTEINKYIQSARLD